jgi:A/G-specific adenine glycosylase
MDSETIQKLTIQKFQHKIYNFYQSNKRDFVWRKNITPYKVFVSEVMLQQTQTSRVVMKFDQWMARFPDLQSLAQATTDQVLSCWQGLGYNRRALALHKSAQILMTNFDGVIACDPIVLQTLPGIGPNTAASICAFAFNLSVIFIETNIRTVFLHEFFSGQKNIDDKQLMPLIVASMDHQNPREWYYALMDYGVCLKKEFKANNKSSKHYSVQSKFIGSRRQVRGAVVRILTQTKTISIDNLVELVMHELPENCHDVHVVVDGLVAEGMIKIVEDLVSL